MNLVFKQPFSKRFKHNLISYYVAGCQNGNGTVSKCKEPRFFTNLLREIETREPLLFGAHRFESCTCRLNMEKEKFEFFGYDLTEWKDKLDKHYFSEVILDIAIAFRGEELINSLIKKINDENIVNESALEINLRTFLKSRDYDSYEQKRYLS